MSNLGHRLRRVASGAAPTLTYIGQATDTADATTYDFGNFTIPSAGLLIVGVMARRTSVDEQVSSIEIDGTTISGASLLGRTAADRSKAAFAAVEVAAGSRNVQATFPTDQQRAAAFVWLAENLNSTTPVDEDEQAPVPTETTIASASISVEADGFALYLASGSAAASCTWSDASERFDGTVDGLQMAAADWAQPGATGGHIETVTFNTATSNRIMSSVSWR